jgi:signal transduction histidine kinase
MKVKGLLPDKESANPQSVIRNLSSIAIAIEDNGAGIPDAIKAKIFQPFFTTKPTGQGTGLGLSLSYDIVTKGHGGNLTLEGQGHQGTTFRITLPLVSRDLHKTNADT